MDPSSSCYVLWPLEDLHSSGFFYGWSHDGLLTVAGVLQRHSLEDSQKSLDGLRLDQQTGLGHPVPHPTILGKYSSSGPRVQLLSRNDAQTDLSDSATFVLFHRASMGSVRFHLEESRPSGALDPLAPQYWPLATSNAPEQLSSRLDDRVLAELNSTYPVHTLLGWCKHGVSAPLTPSPARNATWDFVIRHIFPRRLTATDPSSSNSWFSSPASRPVIRGNEFYLLRQLSIRLSLLKYMASCRPSLYPYNKLDTSTSYHDFNNALWLIMNDLVLGFIIGSFVAEHHIAIGFAFDSCLKSVFVVFIQHSLEWLNDWPAGLKLNTELSSFCFRTFIGALRVWDGVLQWLTPHLPTIVYAAGRAGICGLTVSLALILDVFSLLTSHVSLSHHLLNELLSYQLATLSSLWNLFRGKRYNTLHDHVDSWEYDVDQLLLGTLLFTLFTFTLPTFLAYASLFALMKLVVATVSVSVDLLLRAMNNFPLFALLLKIKDPRRLPGSVSFSRYKEDPRILLLETHTQSVFSILSPSMNFK